MRATVKLFAIICISSAIVSCDKHEKRETKHENGQLKVQFSVLETEEGSFIKDGDYKTWYEGGQPESAGQYEDGKKIGNWKNWYSNGQMKSDLNYALDTLDGKYVWWYENGQKMSEGSTNKLVDIGEFTSWYENGQMKAKLNYKKGQMDGLQIFWYDNGQKASEYTLVNNKLEGEFKNWNKEREQTVNRLFKNGIDPILPKKYKNKGGSTVEILKDESFKFKYQVFDWFYSSWKTTTGTLKVSDNGTLFLGEYQISKLNADTLRIENDAFKPEYNIYRVTEK